MEEKNTWENYYKKHEKTIREWIERFVPTAIDKLDQTPIEREKLEPLLNKIWFVAPDRPFIHTTGFTELTNLLDGFWECPEKAAQFK